MTAGEPVVALSPRKVHSRDEAYDWDLPRGSVDQPHKRRRKLNSTGRLCGPIRLPLYGFTYS